MPRHQFRETTAVYRASTKTLRKLRILPKDQPVRVPAGLIHDLMDRAETSEDIRAFDAAKAASGVLIPSNVMARIWGGENRIRVLRSWRQMSQGALADSAGLSQAYLCEIEKGKNLSARAAKALARALEVDVGDLLPLT
jgi:DNA-binding Xre family transcriptional regulator